MWGRYIRSEFSFQWNLRGARPTATAQPARMGGLYVKGARGRRAGGRLVRNSSAENGSREYPDPALNAAGTAAPIHMPRRRPEVHPPAPRGAEPDEEATDHQRDESLQRAERTPPEKVVRYESGEVADAEGGELGARCGCNRHTPTPISKAHSSAPAAVPARNARFHPRRAAR